MFTCIARLSKWNHYTITLLVCHVHLPCGVEHVAFCNCVDLLFDFVGPGTENQTVAEGVHRSAGVGEITRAVE